MLAQEAMQVVALDEVEDVGVLRRELQEELEGRLLTWGGRLERVGVQGGGAGCKQGAGAASRARRLPGGGRCGSAAVRGLP